MTSARARFRIEGEDATATAFRSVLGNAQSTANKISGMFRASFAGIGIGLVARQVGEWIDMGEQLDKVRTKLRMTAEETTSLAYAFKMMDVEASAFSSSMQKMQVFLSKAFEGGKEQAATLRAIGIELEDIRDLRADEIIERIADGISRLRVEEDAARATSEIFGKAVAEDLAAAMKGGSAAIREGREEAKKFNQQFSGEQLKALADANQELKKFKANFDGIGMALTAGAIPAVNKFFAAVKAGETGIPTIDAISRLHASYAPRSIDFAARDEARKGHISRPGSGGRRGGDSSMGSVFTPGYGGLETDEEKAARIAAARALADAERERLRGVMDAERDAHQAWLNQQEERATVQQYLDESANQMADDVEAHIDELGERLEDLKISKPFEEAADTFRAVFSQAMSDIATNGKIEWDQMLKTMGLRWIQMMADKAISSMFQEKNGSVGGGGGGGWLGAAGSFIGSLFGKGKRNGGDLEPGKWHAVGGNGIELVRSGNGGVVIPNNKLGGGGAVIAPTFNIDARGADIGVAKRLERAMQRTVEGMVDQLERSGRLVTR